MLKGINISVGHLKNLDLGNTSSGFVNTESQNKKGKLVFLFENFHQLLQVGLLFEFHKLWNISLSDKYYYNLYRLTIIFLHFYLMIP